MKMIVIMLFAVFCFPSLAKMSQEEIAKAFEAPEQSQRASKDSDFRKSHLIPEAKFFGSKLVKKSGEMKLQKYDGKGADLSGNDAPVIMQWDGTCTAHGLAATMETFLGNTDLSERHIWSKYQEYSCEAAIKTWEKGRCVTSEKYWPHSSTKPKAGYTKSANCSVYLKKATYIGDDIQAAINSLDKGHPVYLGMSVTNSMMNCDATISPKSSKTDGGHAISIVGYYLDSRVLGGGYFKIKNSWGSKCGDEGYQYVPFYHCLRNDLYCIMWSIDEVVKK